MVAGASAQEMAAGDGDVPDDEAGDREDDHREGEDGRHGHPDHRHDRRGEVGGTDGAGSQAQQTEDSQPSAGGGLGGLLGGLARKAAQKKSDATDGQARVTFMTITNEVLKVATAVAASDVAVPAGFKENK